jgi:hypothetical protein
MIKRSQSGLVSMVTALMVSILLILLATALVGLVTGTQQQASDSELTLRAYASAEGGIEWAYDMIKNGGLGGNWLDCDGPTRLTNVFSGLGDFSYGGSTADTADNRLTCLRVFSTSDVTKGVLNFAPGDGGNPDAVNIVVANSALLSTISSIELSWILGSSGNEQYPNSDPNLLAALPSSLNAAGMEFTVVHYPVDASSNVDTGNINIRNVLFLPSNASTSQQGSEPKFKGGCVPNPGYACRAVIDAKCDGCVGSNSNDVFIIQLRPKYLTRTNSAVSYQVRFLDAAGNPIQVPTGYTNIDAIARSGSFYRRIEAQIPQGPPGVLGQLNYVLYSDRDICKRFSLHREGANFKSTLGSENDLCPFSPSFQTP